MSRCGKSKNKISKVPGKEAGTADKRTFPDNSDTEPAIRLMATQALCRVRRDQLLLQRASEKRPLRIPRTKIPNVPYCLAVPAGDHR